jgi:hypothetical protein
MRIEIINKKSFGGPVFLQVLNLKMLDTTVDGQQCIGRRSVDLEVLILHSYVLRSIYNDLVWNRKLIA